MVEVTGHGIGVGMAWQAIEGERVAEAQPQAPIFWLLQVTIKRLDWMEIVKLIHTVHRLSAIGLAPSYLQNPIPGPSPSLQAPKPQTSEPRVAHLLPVPRCSLSSLAIPYQQTAFCSQTNNLGPHCIAAGPEPWNSNSLLLSAYLSTREHLLFDQQRHPD